MACGSRLFVISCQKVNTKRIIYSTSLHEFMHTFGLDHCPYFDCIMNSSYNEKNCCFQLCPVDLMKI